MQSHPLHAAAAHSPPPARRPSSNTQHTTHNTTHNNTAHLSSVSPHPSLLNLRRDHPASPADPLQAYAVPPFTCSGGPSTPPALTLQRAGGTLSCNHHLSPPSVLPPTFRRHSRAQSPPPPPRPPCLACRSTSPAVSATVALHNPPSISRGVLSSPRRPVPRQAYHSTNKVCNKLCVCVLRVIVMWAQRSFVTIQIVLLYFLTPPRKQ